MTFLDALQQILLPTLESHGWKRLAVEPRYWRRWWDWDELRIGETWTLAPRPDPNRRRLYLEFQADREEELAVLRVWTARPAEPQAALADAFDRPRLEREGVEPLLAALARWRDGLGPAPFAPVVPAPAEEGEMSRSAFESAWQSSGDAAWMLLHLRGKLSERKLRLFACACCRRLPLLIDDERNVRAVEAAERYADGLVPKREMKKARKAACISWLDSYEPAREAVLALAALKRALPAARQGELADLLRDVVGNPFRTVAVRPSWLRANGGAVEQLARAIDEEGRFEDLPILADALEEAGCTDEQILLHCRKPGIHVRGCWLVDLLREKR
jgi:hypothetical protein